MALQAKYKGICIFKFQDRQNRAENFSFKKTTKPLQEWVEEPFLAPDYGKKKVLFSQMQEAVINLEKVSVGQKQMIEERDRVFQRIL